MRIPPLLLPALGALAACAGSNIGSGPISLSPGTRAAYARYLGFNRPLAFAVSADGRASGAAYCRGGDCMGNEVATALRLCRGSGKECLIYDLGGRVVWRDVVPSATPPSPVTAP